MRLQLQLADLDSLKSDLFLCTPQAPLMRRYEAAARALGFTTYNGLLAALAAGPVNVVPDDRSYVEFLGLPADGEALRVVSRAIARIAVRRAQAAFPDLTRNGLDSIWDDYTDVRHLPASERIPARQAALAKRRESALKDDAMDEFELAWLYLAHQQPRKTTNREFGSYGLKHQAENLSKKQKLYTHLGSYVSNGMLIAAAHAHGFMIVPTRPGSLNAYFNISSKTIRATASQLVMSRGQEGALLDLAVRNETR